MNNKDEIYSGSDIVMIANGEVIGNMESITYEAETKHVEEDNSKNDLSISLIEGRETLTLSDVEFGEEFAKLALGTEQEYTLVMSGIVSPRGNKMPKKKRIRNKWIKNYSVQRVFERCFIK